jgi:ribosome-binding factor A
MLFKKNNFVIQKKQSFYEREISKVLYWLIQEYNLPSFSLNYCQLSTRGDSAKVYLSFAQKKKQEEILELINKKYLSIIKKELVNSKKFAYIPNLYFFIDRELETMNNLEKILQKFSSDHEK